MIRGRCASADLDACYFDELAYLREDAYRTEREEWDASRDHVVSDDRPILSWEDVPTRHPRKILARAEAMGVDLT